MHPFLLALLGGMMIGVATVGYLHTTGKVVGISGMIASLPKTKISSALFFLVGIGLSAVLASMFGWIDGDNVILTHSTGLLMIAGMLVGLGTRLGSGCTSGHGICGISRLSRRSIVATLTFMTAGILTVLMMRLFGIVA
ncbi:YeeE/YedE family protein [Moraxella pluranimalium]|uniref:Sulphur transport domain-containing protein n=1 Tax=Moraxella pluranimalium TaxID=470453 RepID=A0A1T0CRV9_9GAMM|nr:hypothetical protein [Moraxella pluranimalium]OOS25118.1 hypothetical protein B0680_03185 [Moraxella pluranimalium]